MGKLTPDNWLISPEVNVGPGYVFSFSAKTLDPKYPNEKIGVYISVEGGEYQQYGTDQMMTADWQVLNVDLSAYAGKTIRIAIVHHNSTDQFAVIVDCAYMLQEVGAAYPFDDVKIYGKHEPYADAILWAAESGITSGYPDGSFRPYEVCTRAQFVTFLWRYEGEPVVDIDNPFTDVAQSPYYQAILWAYSTGVATGYDDGCFRPDRVCSRAEVITFIYREEA